MLAPSALRFISNIRDEPNIRDFRYGRSKRHRRGLRPSSRFRFFRRPDDPNGATASDVAAGKTFWGLTGDQWGAGTGTLAAETVEDDSVAQGAGIYGAFDLSDVDPDLDAGIILEGVSIYGVAGTVLRATGDAAASHVLAGKTFSNAGAAGVAGAMPDKGAASFMLGTVAQTIEAGYYNGSGTVAGDEDLSSGNIKSGANIFGIDGDPNVVDTSSGDAVAEDIASGKKAWVDGAEITGTAEALTPRTGQTTSYGTRDDGTLQAGLEWPTPRFTDNENGTVTDNLTGLVWLKNANCVGNKTWSDALAFANALKDGVCGLTDNSSAGEWHLPNIRELHSLIDFGNYNPALPSGHPFTGVVSSYYWSSTSFATSTDYAWYVALSIGNAYGGHETNTYYVWPVRAGQ